jgi:hypothetical protein
VALCDEKINISVSELQPSGKVKEVVRNIDVSNSQLIDIIVECEQEKVSVQLERRFMSPEIVSCKTNIMKSGS